MNARDVHTLFAYDRWANRRLLASASRLAPADFTRDLGASFGSIRGTLLHILWGERRWLHYWQDGSLLPEAVPDEFPDAAALEAEWSRLEESRRAFADALTDSRLADRVPVHGQDFTLAELIQHIANHSTYHRGQVVLLLRQLGSSPPATDYRLYLAENR